MAQFRISDMLGGSGKKKEPKPTDSTSAKLYNKRTGISNQNYTIPQQNSETSSQQQFQATPQLKNNEPRNPFLQHSDQSDISLRDYWETILRYRVTVIATIAISILISVILSFFAPKKFSSTAKLFSKVGGGGDHYGFMGPMQSNGEIDIPTIIQISKTDDTHAKAFTHFRSSLKPFFIANEENLSKKEKKIFQTIDERLFSSSINIKPDKTSENIILVSSTINHGPFLTSLIANKFSETLIKAIVSFKHQDSYVQLKTFDNLIKENLRELQDIENKIKLISKRNPENVSLTSRETLVFKKLTTTESKLQEAQLAKRELQEQIRTIKVDFGIENIPFEKVRWVDMSEGMQRRLQELQYKREELLTRYKPENPSIKKLDNQIKSLQETLTGGDTAEDLHYVKVNRFKVNMVSILLNLISKQKATENRISFIQSEIQNLNKELVEVPEDLKELRKLGTQREVLNKLQSDLQNQQQQEKVKMLSTNAGLDIIEKATPAKMTSSPGLKKYALGGIFIGIALGISFAFILNNWENTIKSSSDLKRHFKYPSLGVIPQWNNEVKYIDESVPDSNIAEVYGMLRNNVRFCGIDTPEKRLMVASASQTEGKSLTTINLALSFALEGNSTVLISADLRRAYSHTQFKQKKDLKNKKGIVEYLEGKATLQDIFYESAFNNFTIVPTCSRANNPTKLLKSPLFNELLDYAEANYDTVIIDTPAILPVVDATIFSSNVKGVLVIAHANQTPISAIQECINRLEHVNSPIIGIALNKVKDLKLEYFYGYGISNYASYKTYS